MIRQRLLARPLVIIIAVLLLCLVVMELHVYLSNRNYSKTSIKMTFAPIDMTDPVSMRELKELQQKHPIKERELIWIYIRRILVYLQVRLSRDPLAYFDPYLRNDITRATIEREKRLAYVYKLTSRQLTMIWNEGQNNRWASNGYVFTLSDVHFIPLPDK